MIRLFILMAGLLLSTTSRAQETDPDLIAIQQRLESIQSFSADLTMELDVDFIQMPVKTARVDFERGKPIKVSGDDFIMVPRKGLDFSFQEVFSNPYLVVDRTESGQANLSRRTLSIIPTDPKADFALVTMLIDTKGQRILESEMTTKKEGTFSMTYAYLAPEDILPAGIDVHFELEKLKIPLNFMGKDSKVDREALRSDEKKEGKIHLSFDYLEIQKASSN